MYENLTFETILARMMGRISNILDKREGGIIYNAIAPAAAELTKSYLELDQYLNLVFVDTSIGNYLEKLTSAQGIPRLPATYAIKYGAFYDKDLNLMNIPLNSRFSCNGTIYKATKRLGIGEYEMTCEESGAAGNYPTGTLLPIDYIEGLAKAELFQTIIPGEDTESDGELRQRFYDEINAPAFGGNVMAYKKFCREFEGVGEAKIITATDLQKGGYVDVYIVSGNYDMPSETLIENLQQALDPEPLNQQGLGLAPIGHSVKVKSAHAVTVDISAKIVLMRDDVVERYQDSIDEAIGEYLLSLRKSWGRVDISSGIRDINSYIIVRIAQLINSIVSVTGIIDVGEVKINGVADNLTLGWDELPYLGRVTLS